MATSHPFVRDLANSSQQSSPGPIQPTRTDLLARAQSKLEEFKSSLFELQMGDRHAFAFKIDEMTASTQTTPLDDTRWKQRRCRACIRVNRVPKFDKKGNPIMEGGKQKTVRQNEICTFRCMTAEGMRVHMRTFHVDKTSRSFLRCQICENEAERVSGAISSADRAAARSAYRRKLNMLILDDLDAHRSKFHPEIYAEVEQTRVRKIMSKRERYHEHKALAQEKAEKEMMDALEREMLEAFPEEEVAEVEAPPAKRQRITSLPDPPVSAIPPPDLTPLDLLGPPLEWNDRPYVPIPNLPSPPPGLDDLTFLN